MNENTNNASSILDATVDKIRTIADANVVIGDKIRLTDNITAVPISKVSYGFAGGGSDFASKKLPPQKCLFAGGGGGGMNVTPVAILVAKEDEVQLLNISASLSDAGAGTATQAVALIPEMFDKIVALFKKDKDKDKEKEEKAE